MNTQSKSAQTSEHTTPSLGNIIGFTVPRITTHYSDTVTYSVDCDEESLNELRSSTAISEMTFQNGICAISDLLLTIAMNCPDELNSCSQVHALELIFELSGALRAISNMMFVLEKASAECGKNNQA